MLSLFRRAGVRLSPLVYRLADHDGQVWEDTDLARLLRRVILRNQLLRNLESAPRPGSEGPRAA